MYKCTVYYYKLEIRLNIRHVANNTMYVKIWYMYIFYQSQMFESVAITQREKEKKQETRKMTFLDIEETPL